MKNRLYVYIGERKTDRGSQWILRTNDNKRVFVSRVRFNKLCEEKRVYFVSDYDGTRVERKYVLEAK